MKPDGVGTVLPGVEVETVDEGHRPVWGEPGLVRVKSGGCIDGYENNPDATTRMFHDGWFYPGDIELMLGPRSLKLLGRANDLTNIGRQKFTPEHFEERLRHVIGVEDFCVTGITDSAGIEQLCIALVLNNSAILEDIRDPIAPVISSHLGTLLMVIVPKIPRTPTGKPQRKKLNALISELKKTA